MPTPAGPPRSRERGASVAISAGAFGFATTPSPSTRKPAQPLGAFSPFGGLSFGTPSKAGSSSRGSTVKLEPVSRGATPLRDVRVEVTPFSTTSRETSVGTVPRMGPDEWDLKPPPAAERMTSHKLTALSDVMGARYARNNDGAPAKGKGKRPLGEVDFVLPALPKRMTEGLVGAKDRVMGLGAMQDGVNLEDVDMDRLDTVAREEREVGIGVSPRKGKVKWTGRGDPPLSLRLASLLSTESSSTTLFYTSLSHTLHPRARPAKPSPRHPPNAHTCTDTPPSPLAHIKTAPIRLVLLHPLPARAHTSHIWRAAVRRWPTPAVRLHLPVAGDEEDEEPSGTVLVDFVVGRDARGDGVDPRALWERWMREGEALSNQSRMAGEGSQSRASQLSREDVQSDRRDLQGWWEVGVWGEWSVRDVLMSLSEDEDASGEEHEGGVEKMKLLFASRYLVSEDKSRRKDGE